MSNCQFELGPISCAMCDKETDDIGTCEDLSLCAKCRQEIIRLGENPSEFLIAVIEKKYEEE